MANRAHLFLANPKGTHQYFDISRGYESKTIPDKDPEAYTYQKQFLKACYIDFNRERQIRITNRNLTVPEHIDYMKIDFYNIFNDITKNRFKREFGLAPIAYDNFNQTVLFVIQNTALFDDFINLLKQFYESPITVHPSHKNYSIITIIKDFKFLSSKIILQNYYGDNLVLQLINPYEIGVKFSRIFRSFTEHLTNLINTNPLLKFNQIDNDLIELKNIPVTEIKLLVDNFDIIQKVQSFRYPAIRPNALNAPELSWNLNVTANDNLPIIGILDTGVKQIEPLKKVIVNQGFDISTTTNPNPFKVSVAHGTTVASLASLGVDFFNSGNDIEASSRIMSIKIMDSEEGCFSLFDLEKTIKDAHNQGVRIFNLSVVGFAKKYNSNFSDHAYLLDKLAYEYDLLIFIATGNLSIEDIQEIQRVKNENPYFLDYPNHFYNPHESCSVHDCECSNISLPSESLNNMTVGAIADNLNPDAISHLTLSKELPAYYTRKFHYDYSQKINDTPFQDNQKNSKLFKPDIVMPGGDVLNNDSSMQVIGLGILGDFYIQSAGTSLAAPLAANIAARVISGYPRLNMQSIKALVINSASKPSNSAFLKSLVEKLKNEEAQIRYGQNFNELDVDIRRKLSELFNSERLLSYLIGHGLPDADRCLNSTNKRITTILEDHIQLNTHKAININLPLYLNEYPKPSAIVTINATLCYKFKPVLNNHLAYNPLHISFNFCKSLVKDNCENNAKILAHNDDQYFEQFYGPKFENVDKTEARMKALGIKSKVKPWSDDFYPVNSKPFSNTQHIKIQINAEELAKVDNQITLIVRCTAKNDLEPEILNYLQTTIHPFSIALTFEERENDFFELKDFYAEMQAINILENIVELEAVNELDNS
jgi:hypothetical protein